MQAVNQPVTLNLQLTAAEATELLSALHVHEMRFEREMLDHPNFSLLPADTRAILRGRWNVMLELERKAHRAVTNAQD